MGEEGSITNFTHLELECNAAAGSVVVVAQYGDASFLVNLLPRLNMYSMRCRDKGRVPKKLVLIILGMNLKMPNLELPKP